MRHPHAPLFSVLLLFLLLAPGALTAQVVPERIRHGFLGRAELELPGINTVRVGILGGGLEQLEQREPEVAPLAARFRMQRRSAIVLGIAALVGGAVAFERFADNGRDPLELGDPGSNLLMGSLGVATLSLFQLRSADRTLHRIAGRFAPGEEIRLCP